MTSIGFWRGPVDPTKDKRLNAPFYGVSPAPDGAVWGSSTGYPGAVVRPVPGPNPPSTPLAEHDELPLNAAGVADKGFSPRGFDVDRSGVAWLALASGHLASLDRRKCKAPLRVPHPMGFYGKGADGRIDDPGAGWKGRGMYSTCATRAPLYSEGGKGTISKVVKFQLRPNPLAK